MRRRNRTTNQKSPPLDFSHCSSNIFRQHTVSCYAIRRIAVSYNCPTSPKDPNEIAALTRKGTKPINLIIFWPTERNNEECSIPSSACARARSSREITSTATHTLRVQSRQQANDPRKPIKSNRRGDSSECDTMCRASVHYSTRPCYIDGQMLQNRARRARMPGTFKSRTT